MKLPRRIFPALLAAGLALVSCALFPPDGGRVEQPTPTALRLPTPAPAPTATDPATAAVPLTGSQDRPLTLENLNTIAPQDVLEEMMYFYGGAGEGGLCQPLPLSSVTLAARQPETLSQTYCWSDPDDNLRLVVTSPGGKTETQSIPLRTVGDQALFSLAYQFDLSRPAGQYRFQLDGSRASASFSVNALPPSGPVMYVVSPAPDAATAPRQLHLAGFAPGETVRLLVYRGDERLTFLGWQPVTTGADGQARLSVDIQTGTPERLRFVALGPVSGEVHLSVAGGIELPDFRAVCPGAPPSRLHSESRARTVRDLPVYDSLTGGSQISTLAAGTGVVVREGPYCHEGGWWWLFSNPSDTSGGYTAETSGPGYLLEPFQN